MKFATAATALLALPLLAVATPAPGYPGAGQGHCNTGPIKCCKQTIDSGSKEAGVLAGLLGIVLGPIDALLGLNCSPVVGGACDATPVCCSNTADGGLVSIGCVVVQL
ncbi:fungal hydrophobin [Trametopsis cervina]|nr:fungal hydrophobin [Trametopsis cervina]